MRGRIGPELRKNFNGPEKTALPGSAPGKALRPKRQRCQRGLLFEIVGEMGQIIKAQDVPNLSHRPVGLAKQDFGFLHHALMNEFGCGAARHGL